MNDDSTNTTDKPDSEGTITGDQPGTGGGGRAAGTAEGKTVPTITAGDQPGTGGGGIQPVEPTEPTAKE